MNASRLSAWLFATCLGASLGTSGAAGQAGSDLVFPAKHWERRDPGALGLRADVLEELARELGGRGCVIKDGYLVHAWGDQAERGDWYSSVKPVFSTLLFFAIEEGRVAGVDDRIEKWGWKLEGKDRGITFRHLADMTSGYARPEGPGKAWAYNDFAIQLYQQTLVDRVFAKEGSPDEIVASPKRLGRLSFEDGLRFDERRRLIASVRDFARLAWFWQSRGRWGRDQILPASYFDRYMRPDVPADLPRTKQAETSDKLAIGSFGGDSDHFATHGGGIYGFNFWFNACGAGNPTRPTWPDAPADTVMTLGHGGNNSVMIPSRRLVLVSAGGDWGELRPGDGETVLAKRLRQLAASARGVEP